MNRITKKALDALNNAYKSVAIRKNMLSKVPNTNDEKRMLDLAMDFYGRLIDILNLRYDEFQDNYILDNYSVIETALFKNCDLDDNEAAYIFDKIMEFNRVDPAKENVFLRIPSKKKTGYDEDYVVALIADYKNNIDKLTEEELDIVEDLIKICEKSNKSIIDAYVYIYAFRNQKTHTDKEYTKFIKALETVGVTERLINVYVDYYRKKEPVIEVKEAPKKAEKKIVEEIKPFDFKDMYSFLKDTSGFFNKTSFRILFSNIVENDYYYEYLTAKAKYMGYDEEVIKDIKDIKELIESGDDTPEMRDWLNELYCKIEPALTKSFDYEKYLVKSYNMIDDNAKDIRSLSLFINDNIYPEYLYIEILTNLMMDAMCENANPYRVELAYGIYNELAKYNKEEVTNLRYKFLQYDIAAIANNIIGEKKNKNIESLISNWRTKKFFEYSDLPTIDFHNLNEELEEDLKNELKEISCLNYNQLKIKMQSYLNDIFKK